MVLCILTGTWYCCLCMLFFMTLRVVQMQKDCMNTWFILYKWFKHGSIFLGRLSPYASWFPVIPGIKFGVCFSWHWRGCSLESSNCISLHSSWKYNLLLQSKYTNRQNCIDIFALYVAFRAFWGSLYKIQGIQLY